ncbi:MAG: glycosyltransferase family 4 protein [Limnothrix sp.]
MNNQDSAWICCQLGAREHYAIPRALHRTGQLEHLITDAWVKPDSLFKKLPVASLRNLGDRHHFDLRNASVLSFTKELIIFEAKQRLLKTKAWPRMIARNDWYQQKVISQLKRISAQNPQKKLILFTYSYAALEILKFAKSQGWVTVLGQIDPGEEEEKIVLAESKKYPKLVPDWQPVSPQYWQNWRAECKLSDHILVNSNWSKKLLLRDGVEEESVKVIPLVYTAPSEARNFKRVYPQTFTSERPLHVLFLGLITLRKGIAACLKAIAKLKDQPVEFWFVGSQQINVPEALVNHQQVHWVGAVPRSEVASYYKKADIFLFPTLSDGFGLTQLEAQAWGLPIIASKHCAEVVKDGLNGFLLNEVETSKMGIELRDIFNHILANPQILKKLSSSSYIQEKNTLERLASTLDHII